MKKLFSLLAVIALIAISSQSSYAQLNYIRTGFANSYTAITTGGGATSIIGGVGTNNFSTSGGVSNVDDGTAYIPLPFNFTFNGTTYTATTNYIGICTNGYAYLSTVNTNASKITTQTNTNLYTTTTPNATIAPWWDDLIMSTGTCLYQTQGAVGSRTMTIQWAGWPSYFSTSTRKIDFQIIIYETTNVIEFRYGTMTAGIPSTSESASIGIESSVGGNGNYIDALTGSKFTNNSMMTSNKWQNTYAYRFTPGTPTAISAGTYNVGSGQTYLTLSEAIADVNHRGVSGAVTFNLTDALYDSTVAGGGNIFPMIIGPVSGSSATNTITITKSGAQATLRTNGTTSGTIGNQLLTSAIGTTSEPIIGLCGADYVTINNLLFTTSNSTGVATYLLDRGVHLFNSSATDGAQNNQVTNCRFQLSGRLNTNTRGISSSLPTTPTSTAGVTSNNKFNGNSIDSAYIGVELLGFNDISPYTFYDQNNEVGVTSGNTILFGGSTTTAYGVYGIYQNGYKVANNTINVNANHSVTMWGIFLSTGTNSNADIYGNTITLVAPLMTTSQIAGIGNQMGGTGTSNTINIYNNNIINSSFTGVTSSIFLGIANQIDPYNLNIYGNTISGNNYGNGTTTAAGSITYIQNTSGGATRNLYQIYNNTITNNNRQQSVLGAGTTTAISCSNTGLGLNVYSNSITNMTQPSTGTFTGITYTATNATTVNCYSNTINNINKNNLSTGGITGIFGSNPLSGSTGNMYSNTVSNLTVASSGQILGIQQVGSTNTTHNIYSNTVFGFSNDNNAVWGLYNASGQFVNIYKNNVYNLSSTNVSGSPYGIQITTATASAVANVYNNYISELKAPNATAFICAGINIGTATASVTNNIYYNTIYLNNTSAVATYMAAIYSNTAPTLDMRNNILCNNSTSTGGFTVAFGRSSTTLGSYATTSNNNDFYAGSPSANNLIYYDFTNSDQTITAYRSRVATRDNASFTELPTFINTGASPYDLHINTGVATQCESGGSTIGSYTTDYDNNNRFPTAGYPVGGSTPVGPDCGADEFGGLILDLSPPSITYTPLINTTSNANRSFTNVVATDPSSINGTSGTRPRVYYKRSTENNTFAGNTFCDNGWKWVEATGSSSPYDFVIDYNKLYDPSCFLGGVVNNGDVIQYFVVAQDLAATPNVAINSGTFTATPSSVNLTAAAFPITGTINQYTVNVALSGTYTIGTLGGETWSSFTNAGGLFDVLNSGVVGGNITVYVTSDIAVESGAVQLNTIAEDGVGNYTITVVPQSASMKTISGNVAGAMVNFNGSDRITIDGRFGGSGQYLTFANTNTTATAQETFLIKNDSKNITLRNLIIQGDNQTAASTMGVVGISTGAISGTGNDDITITECSISAYTGAYPTMGVVTFGSSSAIANDNITITNNNIFDIGNTVNNPAAVLVKYSNNCVITGNSFYRTTTYAPGAILGQFISVGSGGTSASGPGHTISNNYFGGTAPNCGGTPYTYNGSSGLYCVDIIDVLNHSSATSVSNNTFKNITVTTDLASASNLFYAVLNRSSAGGSVNINSNQIGDNSVNGSTSPSITFNYNSTSTPVFNGIGTQGGTGTVNNNNIGGIKLVKLSTGNVSFVGINSSTAGARNISGNLIGSSATLDRPVINNVSTTSNLYSGTKEQDRSTEVISNTAIKENKYSPSISNSEINSNQVNEKSGNNSTHIDGLVPVTENQELHVNIPVTNDAPVVVNDRKKSEGYLGSEKYKMDEAANLLEKKSDVDLNKNNKADLNYNNNIGNENSTVTVNNTLNQNNVMPVYQNDNVVIPNISQETGGAITGIASSVGGTIDGNTIANISNNPVTANTSQIIGYNVSNGSNTTNNVAVTNNVYRNIFSNSSAGNFFGISATVSGIATVTVTGNTISIITMTCNVATSTSPFIGITYTNTFSNTTVSNNSINTITCNSASGTSFGITGTGSAGTTNVNSNTINGFTYNNTAAALLSFSGISCIGGASNGTYNLNTVSNISSTSASGTFTGLLYSTLTAGFTANITNNTISNINYSGNAVPGATLFNGLNAQVSISGNIVCTGNNINTISMNSVGSSAHYGIAATNTSPSTLTVNNNAITGLTFNSTAASTHTLNCILLSGSADYNIGGNTINNITSNSNNTTTGSGNCAITGISSTLSSANASPTVNLITGNTITNILNTPFTAATTCKVQGIYQNSSAAVSTISKNYVSNLNINTTSTSAMLTGYYSFFGASTNYYNNIFNIGTSTTTDNIVYGIFDWSDNNTGNWYNNTIRVGGTVAAGSTSTAAYFRNSSTSTVTDMKNNIICNQRTGGTGSHLAVNNATSATGWTASNYNDYYSANANTIGRWASATDLTIAGWRTASVQDAYTISGLPSFNATSRINTSDLTVSGRGTYLAAITTDIDGDPRQTSQSTSFKPVDIGADQYTPALYTGNVISPPVGSIYYDNNLRAIEVTSGSFTSGQVRQFTGVRTPNNAMLKQGNVPVKQNNEIKTKGNNDKNSNQNPKKDGTSGGEMSTSAVNTPWVYWEIDNMSPVTEPITLKFYYNDEQLATITEANLRLSFWNGTAWDNSFVQSVDPVNNFISLTLPTGYGWPTTSLFAVEDVGSPLPIVLSRFDASINNRDIVLNWETSMELNNKGFGIERRIKAADGQYANWKEISFIDGKGNSNVPVSYTFSDKKLRSGSYQYRLRQVDLSGNYEYHTPLNNSDMIIGKPGSFDLSQNYPNPSNPKSKIDFQMPFDGKVSIKVYDILGREVASLINEFKPADFYTVEFDGTNIASGTYFYRIIAEGDNQKFTKTLKMILVK